MAKYKVIALSVGGKGNNIFKSGDIVDSSNFDDADALVTAGFLEKMEEKKSAPKAESPKTEAPKEEAKKPAPKGRRKK